MVVAVPAALLVMATAPRSRLGAQEPLQVSAIRFYEPASATTTIEAVCEVRLPALLRGAALASVYRVEVVILDSAGLELRRSEWTREVPAALAHVPAATVLESFNFDAAPGRYKIRVRVMPSEGDVAERTLDVRAYGTAPAMSDLLLASSVRQPTSDTESPSQGEIMRAGLVMRSSPVPRLTPAAAVLSWYAELYERAGNGAGELQAEVLDADGHRFVATVPRAVEVPASGGLTRGSLDLTGLPEGSYLLRLHVRLGAGTVVAEAPFTMGLVAGRASPDAGKGGNRRM